MSNTSKIILAVIIVAVMIIVIDIGARSYLQRPNAPVSQSIIQPGKAADCLRFEIESFLETPENTHNQIICIKAQDGERKVLIPDIQKSLGMKDDLASFFVFEILEQPPVGSDLLLLYGHGEADVYRPLVFAYHIGTGTLDKITEITWWGKLSPDGHYYVFPIFGEDVWTYGSKDKESRVLMIYNFQNHTIKQIVKLSDNETLTATIEQLRETPEIGELSWKNNNTIIYKVYRPASFNQFERELIAVREVKIQ